MNGEKWRVGKFTEVRVVVSFPRRYVRLARYMFAHV